MAVTYVTSERGARELTSPEIALSMIAIASTPKKVSRRGLLGLALASLLGASQPENTPSLSAPGVWGPGYKVVFVGYWYIGSASVLTAPQGFLRGARG